jgi:hypothetical protein
MFEVSPKRLLVSCSDSQRAARSGHFGQRWYYSGSSSERLSGANCRLTLQAETMITAKALLSSMVRSMLGESLEVLSTALL